MCVLRNKDENYKKKKKGKTTLFTIFGTVFTIWNLEFWRRLPKMEPKNVLIKLNKNEKKADKFEIECQKSC